MIGHHQIPEEIAIRVSVDDMCALVENLFRTLGLSEQDARASADVLLYADVRGIDSHGVSNMMPYYVKWLREGFANSEPKVEVVRDAPAAATLDGDRGLGLAVGLQAMKLAIEKAAIAGVGSVVVANSRHCGAAAYYAHMALGHDMIGVAMTIGGSVMLPTFGAEPRVGSNPIAFAAPTCDEPPFVFDAATTSVAVNRIFLTQRLGAEVPPGWIARPDGTPVMEAGPVPGEFLMLPMGGTRENGSHKGYGLAVMVDILSGLLGGSAAGFRRARYDVSHHFLAYRIDAFTDPEAFKGEMDIYMKGLRETPPAEGYERVFYAGLPEHEMGRDRRARGIPYHPEVVDWFRRTAAEFGVDHPLGD
ncbi:MAG: Ldh family oxidoreductase [Truepera sp.]|nr:Ldh family oxidoreductase [Truepera sp.]